MATKPLILEIEEATQEITSAVELASSKHGLPCYLLEPIVADILTRLQNGKRTELENAKRSYEQQEEEAK